MGVEGAELNLRSKFWESEELIKRWDNEVPWVRIDELNDDLVGKEIQIKGWLFNKRSSGKIRFLIVRDGSGFIQAVMREGYTSPEAFQRYSELSLESAIIVRGEVRKDQRAPGGYELSVKDLILVFKTENYPIGKKEHGIDFLLDHRHLWLRHRKPFAVMRIRHTVVKAIREFFDSRGFLLFDAPILTPSACEGTTTLFKIDYFGDEMFLSQSGQLYAEAGALAYGKVYVFGPTFRAERSKTRRHLMEFWMVEPEIAYATLEDIVELSQELVEYIVQSVLDKNLRELEILQRDVKPLEKIKRPFPVIKYKEALRILDKLGVEYVPGDDFGTPQETAISNYFDKPVIITHYPKNVKAFYMKPDPEEPDYVLCMDMLAPEGYGEIIGGSQREEDYDKLLQRMLEENIPIEPYQWYLDLRKYGSVPHSGFGLGLERTIAWITKSDHVRVTIPFPRMLYRYKP